MMGFIWVASQHRTFLVITEMLIVLRLHDHLFDKVSVDFALSEL
jgi:hypothetical protein